LDGENAEDAPVAVVWWLHMTRQALLESAWMNSMHISGMIDLSPFERAAALHTWIDWSQSILSATKSATGNNGLQAVTDIIELYAADVKTAERTERCCVALPKFRALAYECARAARDSTYALQAYYALTAPAREHGSGSEDRKHRGAAFCPSSLVDIMGNVSEPMWAMIELIKQRLGFVRDHDVPMPTAGTSRWAPPRRSTTTTAAAGGIVPFEHVYLCDLLQRFEEFLPEYCALVEELEPDTIRLQWQLTDIVFRRLNGERGGACLPGELCGDALQLIWRINSLRARYKELCGVAHQIFLCGDICLASSDIPDKTIPTLSVDESLVNRRLPSPWDKGLPAVEMHRMRAIEQRVNAMSSP
jgi:hypothetical protein